ncbi:MAG: hypothetical protein P8Y80_04895 [Acidobacteriota bacterium]
MQKASRYMWIVAVVVLIMIYLGWIYYSRWSDTSDFMQHIEENQQPQNQSISDVYSSSLSILNFYAIPQTIRSGETAQLCYGVSNAESIQIEPSVKNVWPSYSRWVDIVPVSNTVYKLTAVDADGNEVTKDTAIKVIQD